jgi:hypothetical protein
MLFSYGSGRQQINGNKKCRQINGNFDCHGDAAVRRGAYRPMDHIRGFTQSHWMPSLVKCLRRITPHPSGRYGQRIRIKHTKH